MSVPLLPPLSANELAQDRRGEILAASVPLLILPTLAVALRFLSRWSSGAGFWWDDLAIIPACIISWGPNLVNLVSLHNGFGRHLGTLDRDGIVRSFKILYAFEFLFSLGMASVKYSMYASITLMAILFQYRIFPIVQFRRILTWCNHFVVCLTISCVLVSVFQCVPIHHFWDSLAGTFHPNEDGRCINVQLYFLISGVINTATDFGLLALPIPILWRLKTSRQQKLVLTAIFTTGLTVCAVSITRLIVLHQNGKEVDFTWYYVPISVWTAAEPSIAVVSACLPSMRPLFVRIFWGGTHRPTPSSTSHYGSKSLCKTPYGDSTFSRLSEPDQLGSQGSPWSRHNVKVYGGRRRGDAESDEVELGEQAQLETPKNRIRANTTVVLTISERVEFQDDLF